MTGISTGALMAPFAFLGSAYDEKLKGLYTGISMRNIAEKRFMLSVLFQDAVADNAPLWKLVEKYITQEMLDAIASEHVKGRILLVGTTNLDARRAVIWNIPKIAASGNPRALELVRTLLIASAAIPGTFPPVMIDVVADRRSFQKHVDGGTVVTPAVRSETPSRTKPPNGLRLSGGFGGPSLISLTTILPELHRCKPAENESVKHRAAEHDGGHSA